MSFWGWLYGTDRLQKEGDALDAKLAEVNRQALDTGVYTQQQYDQAEADRIAGLTGNVDAQVSDSFKEGWDQAEQGLINLPSKAIDSVTKPISESVKKALNTAAGNALSAIPWWLWVLLVLAVGLYIYSFFRRK